MNLNRKEKRMANKVIKHYYDEPTDTRFNLEPDKTKSISELSLPELRRMLERLRSEREVEDIIRDLKRRSGEKDTYEQPITIDTTTPINQLYHYGILGQKWGIRRYQNEDGSLTNEGKKRLDTQNPVFKESMSSELLREKIPIKKEYLDDETKFLKQLNDKLKIIDSSDEAYNISVDEIDDYFNKTKTRYTNEERAKFAKKAILFQDELYSLEARSQFAKTEIERKIVEKKLIDIDKMINGNDTEYQRLFLRFGDPDYTNATKLLTKEHWRPWDQRKEFKDLLKHSDDILEHYGILGQKWGVRRFQNKDGTRTPAGKRRDEASERSEDHVKSRDFKSKAPGGLSNEELKKLNERLQLEETYKRLTAEKIEKSESFVKKAIKNGGEQALTEFSKGIFLGSAKLLVQKASPQFAEAAFKLKDKDKKD